MTPRPPAPLTRTAIRDLLDRHDLSPSRALGQNFLCDGSMVDKIVRLAHVQPGDRVVEIGAGVGSLTLGLWAAGAEVVTLEVDRHLLAPLAETLAATDVEVHHVDAREFDWAGRLGGQEWKVVANLPYNIATPLILDLLATRPELTSWLVMVQREAGERLVADPGSRIYGIPSVLAAYWATSEIVGTVRAELFLPRPKVESVLVRIDRHPEPVVEAPFDAVVELVRAGFGQRRKMLRRSLAPFLTSDQIEAAGVAPTCRPEELHVQQWGALAQAAIELR